MFAIVITLFLCLFWGVSVFWYSVFFRFHEVSLARPHGTISVISNSLNELACQLSAGLDQF